MEWYSPSFFSSNVNQDINPCLLTPSARPFKSKVSLMSRGSSGKRLKPESHRPCPGAAWWWPAPPHLACTPEIAWPFPALAWRWSHSHLGPEPERPLGFLQGESKESPMVMQLDLYSVALKLLVIVYWKFLTILQIVTCQNLLLQ